MARTRKSGGNADGVIGGFEGKKICVVGDIIADVYIFGKPYRLSREAPVVVVKHEEERIYPGSAGNGTGRGAVGAAARWAAGSRIM